MSLLTGDFMKNYPAVRCVILCQLFVIAGSILNSCQGVQGSEKKYEKFLTKIYEKKIFNGNVMIVENGSIAYQGCFGISNIDPIDSLRLNSVFRLGSVSKQFTAMGIIILEERGKLDYDQDIRDFIPVLPYEGITVRHLLNHVSGLPDYVSLMDDNWKPELRADDPNRFISGNQDIINILVKKRPEIRFEPGEKWEYSNTGYVLLASIIRKVSGMEFSHFLKEEIFDPAGMKHTSVYNYVIGPDESMPLRVYGFAGSKEPDVSLVDSHYLNPAEGDGGVYSTLGDLMKWDSILYTDLLVSEDARNKAFTPALLNNGIATNYGFGWFIGKSPSGQKVVEHKGGWAGFRTCIYREIEENNCIVILTNNSGDHLPRVLDRLKRILHD